VYKKVAMVEQFFDIIYSVHVEAAGDTQIRGRAGKHCGQKRTYRAVADQYAFIPREAISKFLLYCIDCQRKNSLESPSGGVGGNGSTTGINGAPNAVAGRPSKISSQQELGHKSSNGEEEGSDTATADSVQSPPLTMSPTQGSDIDVGGITPNGPIGMGSSGHHGPPADTGKLMNSSAAAAFSQAVAAMQSLRSMQQARTSLLVNAAHPHSQLLATQAALLQNSTHPASMLLNGSLQKNNAAC